MPVSGADGGASPHKAVLGIAKAGTAMDPARDCALCPRLVAYRDENRRAEPEWFNGPAPSFGDDNARLLVVGLAPGRGGANRTGRPFTGDYAGDILYPTLGQHGFSSGRFDPKTFIATGDDGFRLVGAMVTNAVRCAPPENKPIGAEANACRPFLAARIAGLARLKVVMTLGKIAHDNALRALGVRLKDAPFGHGAEYCLPDGVRSDGGSRVTVLSSYHTSRYNLNTGRLTQDMFTDVVARARALVDGA